MRPLVHVPHRGEMPKTLLHRSKPTELEVLQSNPHYDQAIELKADQLEVYPEYPQIQYDIIRSAYDDFNFVDEVDEAAARIADVVVKTGNYEYQGMTIKDETEQLTRAYKIRGATNFILKHEAEAFTYGVVTASAGNHGQGVALAAAKIGVPSLVVVPHGTPQVKIDGIHAHGGRVIKYGNDYRAAASKALELSQADNGLYVPAYNHRDIMAGQATIGKELYQDFQGKLSDVLVPTGGGGLLAGLAKYLSVKMPDTRVWGCGVRNFSAVESAYTSGNTATTPTNSFADGIAVAQLGSVTWPEIWEHARGSLTVSELSLRRSVGALSLSDYTVEGAGAAGVAAAIQHGQILGNHVLAVVTGGNIDSEVLNECRALASS